MPTKNNSEAMAFLQRLTGSQLSLGSALQSIRLGEELSQSDFARSLGVSRSHLCDIEKGRKSVSPARAAKWAQLLGYSPEQFVRLALQDQVQQAGLAMKVSVEAA